jgi:hypothetical protein
LTPQYLETIAMDEIRKKLDSNATLPIWPDVAEMFGLCRGSAYAAAQRGDIKVVKIGRRRRVPTAWLKAKLDLQD